MEPWRNVGVAPGAVGSTVGRVRSDFKKGHLAAQWGCGGTTIVGGYLLCLLLLGVAFHNRATGGLSLYAPLMIALVVAAVATLILVRSANTDIWVELNGDKIRARRLFTFTTNERSLRQITEVVTIAAVAQGTAPVVVGNALLGAVRGFEIRFNDLPGGINLMQPEMSNVLEVMQALYARMGQMGELDTEYTQLRGTPVVKRVAWKNRG